MTVILLFLSPDDALRRDCLMVRARCMLLRQCYEVTWVSQSVSRLVGVQAASDAVLERGRSSEEGLAFLDAMQLVQDLHQLSTDLARDASEDDRIFERVAHTRRG